MSTLLNKRFRVLLVMAMLLLSILLPPTAVQAIIHENILGGEDPCKDVVTDKVEDVVGDTIGGLLGGGYCSSRGC